ncbi:MAG: hypothetical protein OHK0029_07510 [Armatimonadaceae bacterium]
MLPKIARNVVPVVLAALVALVFVVYVYPISPLAVWALLFLCWGCYRLHLRARALFDASSARPAAARTVERREHNRREMFRQSLQD